MPRELLLGGLRQSYLSLWISLTAWFISPVPKTKSWSTSKWMVSHLAWVLSSSQSTQSGWPRALGCWKNNTVLFPTMVGETSSCTQTYKKSIRLGLTVSWEGDTSLCLPTQPPHSTVFWEDEETDTYDTTKWWQILHWCFTHTISWILTSILWSREHLTDEVTEAQRD